MALMDLDSTGMLGLRLKAGHQAGARLDQGGLDFGRES